MGKRVNKGFTLIELLVVVTIIVILLALLVPAMDRAIALAKTGFSGVLTRSCGVSSFLGGDHPANNHARAMRRMLHCHLL